MMDASVLRPGFDTLGSRFSGVAANGVVAPENAYRTALILSFEHDLLASDDGVVVFPTLVLPLVPRVFVTRFSQPVVIDFRVWGPWVNYEWRAGAITAAQTLHVFELVWHPQRLGG